MLWWKGLATATYKMRSIRSSSSYRSVTLTSIPCELFETTIKRKIIQHLLTKNLIARSQNALLPGQSCIISIQAITNGLSLISEVVFIDFLRAYHNYFRENGLC